MNRVKGRATAAVLCCVLAAAAAAGCSGDLLAPAEPQIETRAQNTFERTVVVAMDRDYEPYSYFDEKGELAGFDVELVHSIANRAGFNVETRLMTWSDCLEAIRTGEADLVMSLDYAPLEYPDLAFSAAVQSDPFVCFGAEDFDSPADLASKRLATIEGSGAIEGFLTPYKLLDQTAIYPSYTEAIQAVADGQCDYAVVRYSVGRRIVANLGLDDVRAMGPQLMDNTLCIGMDGSDAALVDEVDGALASLGQDGSVKALKEKWLGSYVRFIRLDDMIAAYGTPALVVLLSAAALFSVTLVLLLRKQLAITRCESSAMRRLQEYQKLIIDAAQGLYESISEFDITHNRAGSRETERFFEKLGIGADRPFDEALRIIARQQIKPEHVRGYLDTFSPNSVRRAYRQGIDALSYDFLTTKDDGATYYWVRINARLFYWEADKSLRMIMFRENIEDEKRRELRLMEKAQHDALTGLLNKAATEDAVGYHLSEGCANGRRHALVVVDIDDFKDVNDRYGHAFGDKVLAAVAEVLRDSFRASDIVGRFGGDEFVVLAMDVPSCAWLRRKLDRIVESLVLSLPVGASTVEVTSSVGAALFPDAGTTYHELFDRADQALYQAKAQGKRACRVAGPKGCRPPSPSQH